MSFPLRLFVRWETFLLLVLCATLILGTHVSRYFATSSNISIALASITPVAIVALPMTLVIMNWKNAAPISVITAPIANASTNDPVPSTITPVRIGEHVPPTNPAKFWLLAAEAQ